MFKAEQIEELQKIIKDLYGLSLRDNHLNELLQSLRRRIAELRLGSLSEYLALISNPRAKQELDHLVAQITVGETSFFRTPHQFWALRDFVFPELVRRKRETGDSQYRFLSAGCATGEEPYTLAMVASEALRSAGHSGPASLKVVACDVNRSFLDDARDGVYSLKDVKNMDPRYLDWYFEPKGKGFQLKKQVRDLVHFVHFNLAQDDFGLLTVAGLFDAIFCRNVLIYFDSRCLKQTVRNFYGIMEDHGYLFLGYSESLYGMDARFDCVYVPNTFYYKKIPSPRPSEAKDIEAAFARRTGSAKPAPRIKPARDKARVPAREPALKFPARKSAESSPLDKLWDKAWELFEKEEYEKAHAGFARMIEESPSSPRGYLGMAFILANQGKNEDAGQYLERCFEMDKLVPEGYYLLGLLAERKEEWEKAIENYQRAIFLKSDFTIAHFNLASLYFRLCELQSAQRELKAVKEISQSAGDKIYLSGGWTQKALLDWADSHLSKIEELGK